MVPEALSFPSAAFLPSPLPWAPSTPEEAGMIVAQERLYLDAALDAAGGRENVAGDPGEWRRLDGAVKEKMERELGVRVGGGYADVKKFVDHWARTAGSPSCAIFQEAVAAVFLTGLTPYVADALDKLRPSDPGHAHDREAAPGIVRAMYAYTQEYLAAKGVTEMAVFRGVRYHREFLPLPGEPAREVSFRANPVSSFSVSPHVAAHFAGHGGVILSAKVPAARVLFLPMTGFGCLGEAEAGIIGGEVTMAATACRWNRYLSAFSFDYGDGVPEAGELTESYAGYGEWKSPGTNAGG